MLSCLIVHVLHIDWCNKNYKVEAYPTIYLFHQGQFVEEYNGEHDAQNIYKYINDKIEYYEFQAFKAAKAAKALEAAKAAAQAQEKPATQGGAPPSPPSSPNVSAAASHNDDL
jgi:hypothetical protein